MSDGEPIPLARPALGAREEELALEVLRSGRLSLGPVLERFEREFAAWLGVDDAVAVSSGTAALHLGVRALGWGAGDRVITTPFSFVASANCLLYERATPVFCDIDPLTLNLDPSAARSAVNDGTVGLLPVDIFGYPAALPELEAVAEQSGLGMLEDACEAAGAVDAEGVRVGARGHLATFAFYANKQLTMGEGGVIVAPSPEIAARLRSERNQGRAEDMGWLSHDRLGFNYRLTDLQAALGIAQLERAEALLGERARLAALIRRAPGRHRRRPRRRGRPRRSRAALRGPRGRAAELVRVRGPATRRRRPGRGDRGARRARRGRQGLSALHPPDERTTASISGTGRVSSRSPRGCRGARWRCLSSPPWARQRWKR